MPLMTDDSLRIEGKDDDLWLLYRIAFTFDISTENIEIICESECFELLIEWYLSPSDGLHGHLII